MQLLLGTKSIVTEVAGTPIDKEDTLRFSALQGVRPMLERMPLEKAPIAYARMMRNEARFRMVLTMQSRRNIRAAIAAAGRPFSVQVAYAEML
jgi:D-arabinose 1-dehydrogenase-like Zn-dependent alcohol dehydrogenase